MRRKGRKVVKPAGSELMDYPCIARTGADRRGFVTGRAQGDHRRGADLRSQGAV